MDVFRRCVEDLGAIERLLELPHGYEIARKMFAEIEPLIQLLDAMKTRDPSGAISCLVKFAEIQRARIERDGERLTAESLSI